MTVQDGVNIAIGLATVASLGFSSYLALRGTRGQENKDIREEGQNRQMLLGHENKLKELEYDYRAMGTLLNTHLLDCARTNGASEESNKAMKISLDRLARQVAQLQSQLRLAVSGGANKLFTDDDKGEER